MVLFGVQLQGIIIIVNAQVALAFLGIELSSE